MIMKTILYIMLFIIIAIIIAITSNSLKDTTLARRSHSNPALSVTRIDTVYVPKENVKPKITPVNTKYKVSDIVCVWGKQSGVVINIEYSDNHPGVVIYTVQFPLTEIDESEYYDTELTLGKCY